MRTTPQEGAPERLTTLSAVDKPRVDDEERILEVVRELARETGGPRIASAVTPTASLERDLGLGSLERVELLLRLESALGREVGDRFLLIDTAREIARSLATEAPKPLAVNEVLVRPTAQAAASALRLEDVQTLPDALRRRAAAEPEQVHVFLYEDVRTRPITYRELWDGAARIAAALAAQHGVRRGDTVAIMLPTGLDFLQAFMGVQAAGAVAVPLYPPWRLDRIGEYLQRQSRILANAESRVLISTREAVPLARMLRGAAPALHTITTTEVLRSAAKPVTETPGSRGEPAMIQYTSGSTGDPKGVLLTHANLLANIRAIAAGLELRGTDVGVSWLPLYHDMGLIGAWLCTLVYGIPLGLMSPLSFLGRPERWLWAIHERRATVSAAPNFAYELCARKVRDDAIEGLDLSCWRSALDGAEPVNVGTLERFARRFERYGFRREALMPVYGLAESTVALCFPPVGRAPRIDRVARNSFEQSGHAYPAPNGDPTALSFVSVGRPLPEHEVRIVGDTGEVVLDRTVGRLVFRGPSCMAGYYRNDEATASATFEGSWLESGDLGYRADGELYVTGREKDLIIKGGRNLVPEEVEEIAAAVNGIRRGCIAAFGLADDRTGTERLIVLAESRAKSDAERERLARDVTVGIATALGVPPDDVRVVPPATVPKTPSGKIRRSAARDLYIAGRLGGAPRMPVGLRARLAVLAASDLFRKTSSRIGRALYAGYISLALAVALALLGPVVWPLVHLMPHGRPVRVLGRLTSRLALAVSGCRVTVEGRERLPRGGPLVLVANHTSYSDTPTLTAALPLDFVFVAMQEILGWPLVGTFARRGDHPVVDRFQPQRSVAGAQAVEARLRAGEAVLFFPEGTFVAASGLRPFRLGAFEAAVSTGAAVVPIALRGTRRTLRVGDRFPRPGRIHVWIGEPLRAEGEGWHAAIALRDRAAASIAAHCGEPRLDLVTARA